MRLVLLSFASSAMALMVRCMTPGMSRSRRLLNARWSSSLPIRCFSAMMAFPCAAHLVHTCHASEALDTEDGFLFRDPVRPVLPGCHSPQRGALWQAEPMRQHRMQRFMLPAHAGRVVAVSQRLCAGAVGCVVLRSGVDLLAIVQRGDGEAARVAVDRGATDDEALSHCASYYG